MRKIIVFLLIVFFLTSSLAFELGISPTELNFQSAMKERACLNLTLSSKDYNGGIIGEDKWADKGIFIRDLKIHNKSAEELGIEMDYLRNFKLDRVKKIDVCLKAENKGIFHGVLIFRTMESNLGVGSWIVVNVSGNGEKSRGNETIIENRTNEKLIQNDNGITIEKMLLVQMLSNSFLLIVLLGILIRKEREKKVKMSA